MSDEEIDRFIYDNLPGQALMKHVGEGDEFSPRQYEMDIARHLPQAKVIEGEVPDYPEIAKIILEKLLANGIQANVNDRLAIEVRIVSTA